MRHPKVSQNLPFATLIVVTMHNETDTYFRVRSLFSEMLKRTTTGEVGEIWLLWAKTTSYFLDVQNKRLINLKSDIWIRVFSVYRCLFDSILFLPNYLCHADAFGRVVLLAILKPGTRQSVDLLSTFQRYIYQHYDNQYNGKSASLKTNFRSVNIC